MRKQERLTFIVFEVSSFVCFGLAWYYGSPSFAVIGLGLLTVTVTWFIRLAKRFRVGG